MTHDDKEVLQTDHKNNNKETEKFIKQTMPRDIEELFLCSELGAGKIHIFMAEVRESRVVLTGKV